MKSAFKSAKLDWIAREAYNNNIQAMDEIIPWNEISDNKVRLVITFRHETGKWDSFRHYLRKYTYIYNILHIIVVVHAGWKVE